jgi:DMSO/TMAO reductase YedYZ molybdopterin-dependent catalytic subunit
MQRTQPYVDNPVELSLADIERLGIAENITRHHCIQGWAGIAKWGGLPMKFLVELLWPKPNARVARFSRLAITQALPTDVRVSNSSPWGYKENFGLESGSPTRVQR